MRRLHLALIPQGSHAYTFCGVRFTALSSLEVDASTLCDLNLFLFGSIVPLTEEITKYYRLPRLLPKAGQPGWVQPQIRHRFANQSCSASRQGSKCSSVSWLRGYQAGCNVNVGIYIPFQSDAFRILGYELLFVISLASARDDLP